MMKSLTSSTKLVRIESVHKPISEQNYLTISWDLNKRCNYDCSYCPPAVHDKTSPFFSLEEYQKAIRNLSKNLSDRTHIHWTFSGGEPFINPRLFDIMTEIVQSSLAVNVIQFITNFSASKRRYEEIFDYLKDHSDRIFLNPSFHREFADPDEFIEKVKWITGKYVNRNQYVIMPTIMLPNDPIGWDTAHRIFQEIKDISGVDIRPIRKDFGSSYIDYTAEQRDWIDSYYAKKTGTRKMAGVAHDDEGNSYDLKSPSELTYKNLNRFSGWTCVAGYQTLYIGYDLTVARSVCGKYHKPHQFGNLLDDDITLFNKPMVCVKETCNCTADIPLDKWKEG